MALEKALRRCQKDDKEQLLQQGKGLNRCAHFSLEKDILGSFFQAKVMRGVEQGWGNGAGSSQQCGSELWHSLPRDGAVSREKIMEKKSVEVY